MLSDLHDVIWGSRFFIHTQFVSKLLALLVAYKLGKCTLSDLFKFTHTLQRQRKIKLYNELKIQLQDFIELETLIKKGEITENDSNVINYTVNRLLNNFTEGNLV